jgi:hypothetical protein
LASSKRYERICSAEKGCQNLFIDYDKLTLLREGLPGAIFTALGEAAARLIDRKIKASDSTEAAEEADEQVRTIAIQKRRMDDSIASLNRQIGGIQNALADLQLMQERINETPKPLLEGQLDSLRAEATRIRVDLSAFHGVADPSAELRARAQQRRKDSLASLNMAARLRAMDSTSRTSWMDILSEYPEPERDPLLRLLNPDLLNLAEGPEGMQVLDPEGIGCVVKSVAAASLDGYFTGVGVRVNLAAIPAPRVAIDDPVAREQEVLRFEGEAEKHELEAKRLEELAKSSQTVEALKKKLDEVERQAGQIGMKIASISGWEEQVKDTPVKVAELAEAEKECSKQAEARASADAEYERFKTLVQVHKSRAGVMNAEIVSLQGIIRDQEQKATVLLCDLEEPVGFPAAPAMSDADFRALLQQTSKDWEDSLRLDADVVRKLEEIEELLAGMVAGDQMSKVATIRDLVDGLPDQKAQLDSDWQHIADLAKNSFGFLIKDYQAIEKRVQRLNRLMGRFSISNLSGVQFRILPVEKTIRILREFTQDSNLFTDTTLANQAKEHLGSLLQQEKVFKLGDLFTVQIEVSKGDEKEIYQTLDIESVGTAITLKVVFLAHILRDLFGSRSDARLLIFVDEVDSLDDVNQETVRICAKELGFMLIMASPNPANASKNYFLRHDKNLGKTYIYPEESLDVVFLKDPEIAEGGDESSVEAVS